MNVRGRHPVGALRGCGGPPTGRASARSRGCSQREKADLLFPFPSPPVSRRHLLSSSLCRPRPAQPLRPLCAEPSPRWRGAGVWAPRPPVQSRQPLGVADCGVRSTRSVGHPPASAARTPWPRLWSFGAVSSWGVGARTASVYRLKGSSRASRASRAHGHHLPGQFRKEEQEGTRSRRNR